MGTGHLSDDRLIEMCFAEAPVAAEQQHLVGCPACSERGVQLARLLTDVSTVTVAEADALFDAERLTRQRARILQRLQADGRPGRVLAFPATGRAHGSSLRGRPGMRWIAGAAAAGLVIGILADHLAHVAPGSRTVPVPIASEQPPSAPLQAASAMSEEELLGLLEAAIDATGGSSLRPLDDLTPRVWEIAAR